MHVAYRRFIAGPTLNNFFLKVDVFFGNYHLMLLKSFEIKVTYDEQNYKQLNEITFICNN
jgi:hypothetical protein